MSRLIPSLYILATSFSFSDSGPGCSQHIQCLCADWKKVAHETLFREPLEDEFQPAKRWQRKLHKRIECWKYLTRDIRQKQRRGQDEWNRVWGRPCKTASLPHQLWAWPHDLFGQWSDSRCSISRDLKSTWVLGLASLAAGSPSVAI